MSLRNLVQSFARFNYRERLGILVLILILIIVWFLPSLLPRSVMEAPIETRLLRMAIDSLEERQKRTSSNLRKDYPSRSARERFEFDPNIVSQEELIRLGLTERQSATIINYRNKRGKFYRPEDLEKIWGLEENWVAEVMDLVRISQPAQPDYAYPKKEWERKPESTAVYDLNEADSASLESLPGIGPKLASRILSFRRNLGGFHSVDQLKDVYGLSDSVRAIISPRLKLDKQVSKMDLNNVSLDALKQHPYVKWKLAGVIVAYRNQHGGFGKIEDLKKIHLINDSIYKKLFPYFEIK